VFLELEDLARRLERQLESYEKLHKDEMKRFQEQFEAFQRIQADELEMLRSELAQLKQEIAMFESEPKQTLTAAAPNEPARVGSPITRRDLLTGNIPTFKPEKT
jgi:hypothetical protein